MSDLSKKRRFLKRVRDEAARKEQNRLKQIYQKSIFALIEKAKAGDAGDLELGAWLFGLDVSWAFTVSQHALDREFMKLNADFASRTTTMKGPLPKGTKLNLWGKK